MDTVEHAEMVEAAVTHLQQLMAGLHVLGALADWLERPKKSFSYTQPDGGMFAAILEEAKSSKALPQEKRPEAIGIQHPGHTAPRGPLREEFAPFSKSRQPSRVVGVRARQRPRAFCHATSLLPPLTPKS